MEYYTHVFATIPLPRVAVAALVMLIISSLWFSPFMFARSWIRHTGIRPTDRTPANRRAGFIVRVFLVLLCSYLVGLFAIQTQGVPSALIASVLLMWLFIMIEQLSSMIWRREPFALFLLLTTRSLVCISAAAIVYYVWSLL
jgi:hypothetical protein